MCIRVEGIEVSADPLDRSEVLYAVSSCKSQEVSESPTCTAPAPVSRVLLVMLSGSPTVLFVTGKESII
jgi:hypothetical protein